jgi:hypothetical protein
MENIRIVIDLNTITQRLDVNGPLDNGTLFLGMLEMAKVVFMERRLVQVEQELNIPKNTELKQ